jgi:phosphoglycerate kinase
MITSITDVDVAGKRVLTRVDFNVPQDDDGNITDDNRIRASLPTIQSITERGGIAVLMSHLGRPKGKPDPKYTLAPVAESLRTHIPNTVHLAPDCIGQGASAVVTAAQPGDIVLLENLRFHAGEEANDPDFIKGLAELGDLYCNDAFGTAHRAHASTEGVAHKFSVVSAGLLMQKELDYLGHALENPKRPLVAVLGGSKISGKIDVITALMGKCDAILVGGGMMFTFFRAQGLETGASLVEEDKIELAAQILERADNENIHLVLPTDTIVAPEFSNEAPYHPCPVDEIADGMMGLDIGPETVARFANEIRNAGTVVWNGPMGVFEMSNFARGTQAVAEAMVAATKSGAVTIVGGGDSASAIAQFGFSSLVTHVSTGGGASLEFLEGKTLPGVAALDK